MTGILGDQLDPVVQAKIESENTTQPAFLLREGAATADNGALIVERGSTGNDALWLWNENLTRFEFGLADTTAGTVIPVGLAAFSDIAAGNYTSGSMGPMLLQSGDFGGASLQAPHAVASSGANGRDLDVYAGDGDGVGLGGNVQIYSGRSPGNQAGDIFICGNESNTLDGSPVGMEGGSANSTGGNQGGMAVVRGGTAIGAGTNMGGDVLIRGGVSLSATGPMGGDVYIEPGVGNNTGNPTTPTDAGRILIGTNSNVTTTLGTVGDQNTLPPAEIRIGTSGAPVIIDGDLTLNGTFTQDLLNLGNATQAVATGDLAAGDTAAGGFFYDASSNSISFGQEASAATLQSRAATTLNTIGGSLLLNSGDGDGTAAGGSATLSSGQGGATGNGGALLVTAGDGGPTSGNGGDVTVTAGGSTDGNSGSLLLGSVDATGTDRDSGDVCVVAGLPAGAGAQGIIKLQTGSASPTTHVTVSPTATTVSNGLVADRANIGATADAVAVGDLAAGTAATGGLFYDASAATLTLGLAGNELVIDPSPTFDPTRPSIYTVDATPASGADGRELGLFTGDGDGVGDGGSFQLITGNGGDSGNGGNVFIYAGNGGTTAGAGGMIEIISGEGASGNSGSLLLGSSNGTGTGDGGNVTLGIGRADGSGSDGLLRINTGFSPGVAFGTTVFSVATTEIGIGRDGLPTVVGGADGGITLQSDGGLNFPGGALIASEDAAPASNALGKALELRSGDGDGLGHGGTVCVQAGTAGATGNGGQLLLKSGDAVDGNAGDISIDAPDGAGTSGDGGTVSIISGVLAGTGADGSILLRTGSTTPTTRVEVTPSTTTVSNTLVADRLNVGTATDAAAAGDLAAGATGAARMVYDQSDAELSLYDASNVLRATTNAATGLHQYFDSSANSRIELSDLVGLTLKDAGGTVRVRANTAGWMNVGSLGLASGAGEFSVGDTGAPGFFWDASKALLSDASAANRITLNPTTASISLSDGTNERALLNDSGNLQLKEASGAVRLDLNGDIGYLRVGTATDATAVGDFTAGAVGATRVSWDASAGALRLYDGSGTQRVRLQDSGYLQLGSATDAVGEGDLSAGVSGGARLVYDQSGGTLSLRNGSGDIRVQLDDAGFANLGSAVDASAIGDFSTGVTGAARMFYDQGADTSNGTLRLFGSGGAAGATLSGVGYARLGTATDAVAVGDLVAGVTGAARLFYDQSADLLTLFDSSNSARVLMGASGVRVRESTGVSNAGQLIDDGSGNGQLDLFDTGATTRKIRLSGVGYAQVGTATDAAANGDLSAGLTGAARMFYDQSAGTLDLFDSAGNSQILFDANNAAVTLGSTLATVGNVPTGAGAAQLEWLQVTVNGNVRYIPLWG